MDYVLDVGECSSSSSTGGSGNIHMNGEYEVVNFDEDSLDNIIEESTAMESDPHQNDYYLHDNVGTETKRLSITDVWNRMRTIDPKKYGGKYSSLETYLIAEDSDCSSIDWNENVDSDEEEAFHNPPDVAIFKHDEKAKGPTVSLHNDLYECAFESYDGQESANSYIDKITKKLANSQSINTKFHKRGEYLSFSTPKRLYKSPTGISQGYTFDVSNRRFVPHSFQHLCTAQSNADPLSVMPRNNDDPGAAVRQNMLTVMHQLFPTPDVFEYAMDILMSLLVSGNHSRMIVVCWGKRRNGKSLFLNIVSKMFEGKRLIIHVPKRLLYKRGESEKDSTTKECLGEDRLAVINELVWGAVSQSGYSMLKSMVGSDVNANRGPYGMDNNNAMFNAVPMIVSNDKPSYLPCEGALSDRIRVLPFFSTFLEGNEYLDHVRDSKQKLGSKKYVFEADPTLLDKNKVAEISNALMLYICARTRYLRFNLNEIKSIRFSAVPKESWALKNKLEEDADPLFRFCRRLSKGANLSVRICTLAIAFEQFMVSNYNKAQLEPVIACYTMSEIIQILSDRNVSFTATKFDELAEDFLFINRLQLVCQRMNFWFDSTHTSVIGCAMSG